ncbi:MAG: lipoprotein insertase outer membrane protein LolB [Cycloclasticus sp.]
MRYCFLALFVTQLLACASVGSIKMEPSLDVSPYALQENLAIKHWRLLGRLSVRNASESWLTKLEWRHELSVDDLTLSTSLGGVVAKLRYSNHGIVLVGADAQARRVSENELQSLLGYSPPLAQLKYWVRGLPDPNIGVRMSEQQIAGVFAFQQDGWAVKLERFAKVGEMVLPSKISLSKERLKIKLVVDEWLT